MRAGLQQVVERVHEQCTPEAAAAFAGGDRERAHVAAAAVEHTAGHPSDRAALAASEEQRTARALLVTPRVEVAVDVALDRRPGGVDEDEPVYGLVVLPQPVRRDV